MVVIDEIIGRDEDVVRGPDGREMVRFHGLYIDIAGLAAGQLIQHEPDRYTINLQIEPESFNRSVSEKIIYQRLVSQLGNVKLKFEYPEKIPTGPNGKFKAVISEITATDK
jgi:phenylacetate-CoA ligase